MKSRWVWCWLMGFRRRWDPERSALVVTAPNYIRRHHPEVMPTAREYVNEHFPELRARLDEGRCLTITDRT